MTFSAPKSVSVLWALSTEPERQAIEQAHRSAVLAATAHLERNRAWARRGKAGTIREQTAGLLMAQFDHHTSRESDPQLHTHCFIFNLAPRRDGSWGAIVSRELYKAQKDAGAIYRRELASELERLGYRLDRRRTGSVSPRSRAISNGRSRNGGKRSRRPRALTATGRPKAWNWQRCGPAARSGKRGSTDCSRPGRRRPRTLGFELGRERQHARPITSATERSHVAPMAGRLNGSAQSAPAAAPAATVQQTAAQLGSQLGQVLRSLDQPSGMAGIKVRLRQSDRERERE